MFEVQGATSVEASTERLREICERIETREFLPAEIAGLLVEIDVEFEAAKALGADELVVMWRTLRESISEQSTPRPVA